MQLHFLSPLLSTPGPWASAYLDTQHATADASAQQELLAREAGDLLAEQGADEATCGAVRETLAGHAPGTPGRALFAAGGRVVLDLPLTTPPPAPPLVGWSTVPRIAPLLRHGVEDRPCLVARIDRTGADIEIRGAHGRGTGTEVHGRDWPVHRTSTSDWSERHFQLAVENTWEENAARVADVVAEHARREGAELVVLAGDARESRAVLDRLPEDLRSRTVETEHGGRAAGSATARLDEAVEAARAERARQARAEVLERFRAGRMPDDEGRIDAAEGVHALVEAAREHRIGTLIVRPEGSETHREVWVGPEPDQLAARRSDSQYLGEPRPEPARADDALLRSAVAGGAEVVWLPGSLDAEGVEHPRDVLRAQEETEDLPAGGLGALLRWPYVGGIPSGGSPPTAA